MPSKIGSIIRKSQRKIEDPLNIFCMPTHENYESSLAKTGHNFYSFSIPGQIRSWNNQRCKPPDNYILLTGQKGSHPFNHIPPWVNFDLILSQQKPAQFEIGQVLAEELGIPLVSLTHTSPTLNYTDADIKPITSMKGHKDVFVCKYNCKAWGFEEEKSEIVYHGIDTNLFLPKSTAKENYILSIVHNWRERDIECGFTLWQQLTQGFPTKVVGDNPGLSKMAKNQDELIDEYNKCQIFLNTTITSTSPMTILEAMACGCAVVSTNTCSIPEIIQDGVNGILFDPKDIKTGRKILHDLIEHPTRCQELGEAARKTVEQKFYLEKFVDNWNNIFYEVIA